MYAIQIIDKTTNPNTTTYSGNYATQGDALTAADGLADAFILENPTDTKQSLADRIAAIKTTTLSYTKLQFNLDQTMEEIHTAWIVVQIQ
jgi:hypothetical protein